MQDFIDVRIRNENDLKSSYLGRFSPEYLPFLVKLVKIYGFSNGGETGYWLSSCFVEVVGVVGSKCYFEIVVGEKA